MRENTYTTIRTEGALLPPETLQRIAVTDDDLGGFSPDAYLRPGERLNEAINRAWNTLQGIWASFSREYEKLPDGDPAIGLTRSRWLLPLMRELDFDTPQVTEAVLIDGRSFPISHRANGVPLHLVGAGVDLDRRTRGVAGAAQSSPHSLLQSFLNRDETALWGIVSNGHKLRLLRDSASLTRQAYVEFDLRGMMDGEQYADFVVLWLTCHASRFANGRECWLEKWAQAADKQGQRALDTLRDGVQAAIEALGAGFIAHPANGTLRDRLQSGDLSTQDYYRQLLRVVYRLLVMFVGEDRGVLIERDLPETSIARKRYMQHYSARRLRTIAERFSGTAHGDLWESLQLVMRLLGGETNGAARLGLPVLGSFLFSGSAIPDLNDARLSNSALLTAVRALAYTEDRASRVLRPIDYRNLGAEELGSVYESLLELYPQINIGARVFTLNTAAGSERKTTGSYYTPHELVDALLKSALDPVIAEAERKPDREQALLNLKVCDPACGSGHFLIAAGQRIALALARVRTGEESPTPENVRMALREVVSHCLYGVDLNEMAVELCKVSLWLEALEPGKPLSFLEHRIQHGNSLLGTTPELMANGIPDEAFAVLGNDDKAAVSAAKKENKRQRKDREAGQMAMFSVLLPDTGSLADEIEGFDALSDDDLTSVQLKEDAYLRYMASAEVGKARMLADAWCAAFVWPHGDRDGGEPLPALDDLMFRMLSQDGAKEDSPIVQQIVAIARRYHFFHWHLAFPDVFDNGGGFDVVLGNPPWEQTQLDDREFFAVSAPEIANASNMSERKKMLSKLEHADPYMFLAYQQAVRYNDGIKHFVHASGRYPFTSFGRLNTAPLFCELGLTVISSQGISALIVPTGIATDSFNQYFFNHIVDTNALSHLYDFENATGIFPAVHRSYKFCILTLSGSARSVSAMQFAFFAHDVSDLVNITFTLSREDIALLNPNTRTTPIFRSQRDAELTKSIYRRIPILIREGEPDVNLWGIKFQLMFMMNTDSGLFRNRGWLEERGFALQGNHFVLDDERYLPLYEAKMMHQFTHRWATYTPDGSTRDMTPDELRNPSALVIPRYWVHAGEVAAKLDFWKQSWLLGFRDIARSTDERTAIFGLLPLAAIGNKVPLWLIDDVFLNQIPVLYANTSAYTFDYVVRQKTGSTSLNFFYVKQFPVIPPHTYTPALLDFIVPRVLELTYTAWDLQPFAQDVGCDGPPFIWDEERRFLMRCELDALYFHLYQIPRDDVDYIMDTFPIVKRKDEASYGLFRTKDIILEMYDQMADLSPMAVPSPKGDGTNEGTYRVPDVSQWETWLDPPPADPSAAHRE